MPDEAFPVRRRIPQDVCVVGAECRRYGGQDEGDDCASTGSVISVNTFVSALRSPDLGEWRSCLITRNSQRANPAGHPRDGLAYRQHRRHSSPHRGLPSRPVRPYSRRASAPATALPERRQGGDRPQAPRAQNRGAGWRHGRHPDLVSRAVADRPLTQSLLSL